MRKSLEEERKRLHQEIASCSKEGLEKKLLELSIMFEIAREVNSTLDLEEVLGLILDRAADILEVELVSLMLVEEETGELVIKVARGLEEGIVKTARVKMGENISGLVAESGEPLLVPNIDKDPRFVQRDGERYYNRSLLSVPLKAKRKVIGVINVNNKADKGTFNQDDLLPLTALSNQAAMAIENSRLHERVRRKAEALEAANQELKKVSEEKREFVSQVSHDLRTPLTSIKGFTSILLTGSSGELTQGQKEKLEKIGKHSDRLTALIKNLVEHSRGEKDG
ncbi:GAF domain-containing protein [candidate division NPL-UPA2 bacterium]|nr:GAF domain-containing protein [candidate division NPL-UPA2 bacterium]